MPKVAAGKIKIIAIVASLAGLALVLSPTFSLLQIPGTATAGTNGSSKDAEFLNDDTVVANVSEEDLAMCGSLNDSVDEILGVVNDTSNDRKVASDTLIAEFCSRPVLIHEIMTTDQAALSLVAYACDASSGKVGTAAIQDSLSDHKEIYCASAKSLIVEQTNTFIQTVKQFRTEYLPLFEADLEANDTNDNNATTSHFNSTSVEITLDEVTQSLEKCLELVDAGDYYPAAKSFDNASKKFIGIFQEAST